MTEPSRLASVLASRLRALWGPEVEVTGARPLPGGASREFHATEAGLGADPDPRLRFHARVAANALRIAEREAMLASAHAHNHRTRLAALDCEDDAELCAKIRGGSLDHRFGEVVAAVRATTVDKLTVANPGHLAIPG